jgi:F0F1-type ATP synthase assembly protein I
LELEVSDSKATEKSANQFAKRLTISAALSLVLVAGTGLGWQLDGLDGLTIGLLIALCVVIVATVIIRTQERKITKVELDQRAKEFVQELSQQDLGVVRLLAQKLEQDARRKHSIQIEEGNFIFVEVEPKNGATDPLLVTGHEIDKYRVLRCQSPAVADAIAALLLHLRDQNSQGSKVPHIYMSWSEIHPLTYALKYALFGEGETAPLIRENLRLHEPEPNNRPIVHVA